MQGKDAQIKALLSEMTREERVRALVRVLEMWHWYKPSHATLKKWAIRKRKAK